jgi:hypothetical protein
VPVNDQVGLGWATIAALAAMAGVLVVVVAHLVRVMRFVFGKKEP